MTPNSSDDRLPCFQEVFISSVLGFIVALLVVIFIWDFTPPQTIIFMVGLPIVVSGMKVIFFGSLRDKLRLWQKILIIASGVIVLIILIYLPKLNPIEQKKIEQPLSGVILDEQGNPLSGVKVMIEGFDMEKITNDIGSFSFEIEAEKEKSVKLIVQKQGFKTIHQYVSLGNTSFSISMKKQ